jgi:hypothetical protein
MITLTETDFESGPGKTAGFDPKSIEASCYQRFHQKRYILLSFEQKVAFIRAPFSSIFGPEF